MGFVEGVQREVVSHHTGNSKRNKSENALERLDKLHTRKQGIRPVDEERKSLKKPPSRRRVAQNCYECPHCR